MNFDIFVRLKIFLKQIFSINNFDNHLVVYFLGFRIRKKLKSPEIDLTLNEYGLNKTQRDVKITLSLTSYPKRINIVPNALKTLLKQTLKPDNLVLWLSWEQFPNREDDLPKNLLDLKQYGLTIKWCKDIRSYKKLIPSLVEYPDDIIITVDDDIYYPFNLVEGLYLSYLKDKTVIHSNRIRRLKIKNGKISSVNPAYHYWSSFDEPSFLNKITGSGGVLYPPHSLSDLAVRDDIFMKLIPTQDDVWFFAMALLNNVKIKAVSGFQIQLPSIDEAGKTGLCKINKKNSGGINSIDAVIKVAEKFPEIKEKLLSET